MRSSGVEVLGSEYVVSNQQLKAGVRTQELDGRRWLARARRRFKCRGALGGEGIGRNDWRKQTWMGVYW